MSSMPNRKFKPLPFCNKCKGSLIFREGIREKGIYFSIGDCIKCNETYKINHKGKLIKMKIAKKEIPSDKRFENIRFGQAFWDGGILYVKMDNKNPNAVRIVDGHGVTFNNDIMVLSDDTARITSEYIGKE